MTPDRVRAANTERFRRNDGDSVLLGRLRMVIYPLGLGAACVAITMFRFLAEM